MIIWLSLGGILCALFLANVLFRRWQRKLHAEMASHATREGIRQEMHLDRWSKGEMPLSEPAVDKSLARKIAHRKSKPGDVLRFRAGGE